MAVVNSPVQITVNGKPAQSMVCWSNRRLDYVGGVERAERNVGLIHIVQLAHAFVFGHQSYSNRSLESAIANHKFETARQWAEEEKSERLSLSRLREEFARQPPHGNTVTPNDILEVVAERAGTPVAGIRQVIEREADGDWERTVKTLAGSISTVGHEWLACLASYLIDCSVEEAEKLAQAILALKNPGKL